jgi:ribonuclease HI
MTKRPAPARGRKLFDEPGPLLSSQAGHHTANIDGAARGNPGPASYGVAVRDPAGTVVARLKKYIGRMTNNVAEYYALIAALDYAQAHGIRALRIESDSELMVKQMRGQYKVKSVDLKPLFERARKMSQGLASFAIAHVYREQNREADTLANEALDETAPARVQFFSGKKLTADDLKREQEYARKRGCDGPRVRVRYRNGALQLLEPLALADNEEIEVTLHLPVRRS